MTNETHTRAWRIPRTADGLLKMLIDDFQRIWQSVWSNPLELDSKEMALRNSQIVNLYGQIHLLGALRQIAPEEADKVAASLAEMWDGGDGLGEWVYQWRTELEAGLPLTMLHDDEAGQQ